jgi:hypothetical protein
MIKTVEQISIKLKAVIIVEAEVAIRSIISSL